MSNPMLATTNSNLDIRVKEPSDGAPPTSGIGGPSTDRFNLFEGRSFTFSRDRLYLNFVYDGLQYIAHCLLELYVLRKNQVYFTVCKFISLFSKERRNSSICEGQEHYN